MISPAEESYDTEQDGYRVHVADIGVDTSDKELERAFGKFGQTREVWMAKNPPCFAFIVYKNPFGCRRCHQGNGRQHFLHSVSSLLRVVANNRVRVSWARPRTRGTRRSAGFDRSMRCYQCGETGHFSRDCNRHGSRRRRYSDDDSDDDRRRRRKRSRSRSTDRKRTRRHHSRSRSPRDKIRSRTRSRSKGRRSESPAAKKTNNNVDEKINSKEIGEPANAAKQRNGGVGGGSHSDDDDDRSSIASSHNGVAAEKNGNNIVSVGYGDDDDDE
ncbi:unnamed protein product [Sphagnum tenellum]